MFPYPHTVFLVREQQRQEWLAEATRLRLAAGTAPVGASPRRWTFAVLAPVRAVASTLGRLGALAHDGRESLRSKVHDLAALGVTWAADSVHERKFATELHAVSSRGAVPSPRYPTLDTIDRALDAVRPRFAAAANAAHLELRARELTEQYWSESAWLTGHVPVGAFERVCAALECERIAATETPTPLDITEPAGESVFPAAA